jgi:uncharacterized protein (DUF2147 family)
MKHRIFAPAFGVLAAALFAAGAPSLAFAADPSGIWLKEDGSGKIEVKHCGRGICGKVVWLRDPIDSRGKPLHDARNEDASMRDRPILGLALFSNMPQTEPNTWVGSVYNPEEGHIYTDIKITLVSANQIVLKGCKAWLLCGEKTWTRSKLVPTPVPDTIEVKAPGGPGAPGETTKPTASVVEASAHEPGASPAPQPARGGMPAAAIEADAAAVDEPVKLRQPRASPPTPVVAVGPGLVVSSATPEPLPLSGENVPSMMMMTTPAQVAAKAKPKPPAPTSVVEAAAEVRDLPEAVHAPKPRMQTQAAQADLPVAEGSPRLAKPKPKPREPEEQLPWLQH